jgi:hypothetical protein
MTALLFIVLFTVTVLVPEAPFTQDKKLLIGAVAACVIIDSMWYSAVRGISDSIREL